MQNKDIKYFSFDAAEVEELKVIIRVIMSLNKRVLWVGSTGLAEVLAGYFYNEISKAMPVFAVIGSINSISAAQAYRALEKKTTAGVEVDIKRAVLKPEEEKDRLLNRVVSKMDKGFDILLTSALNSDQVIVASSLGKKLGMPLNEISSKIADFLGFITCEIIGSRKISGLFLTGVDTTMNVVDRLSIRGSIVLEEFEAGIPVLGLKGGPFEGLKLITKPGPYGNADTILNAINYLKKKR